MKNYLLAFVLVFVGLFWGVKGAEAVSVAQKLSGRILLQVESHGEGWYVHPVELVRYYLGKPEDAFSVMRQTGVGISNKDLGRIAVSTTSAVGDRVFAKKMSGKILLQVQSKGEAWYVNPLNLKRYYLGRPVDAFAVMRQLGLGITDNMLGAILTKNSTTVSSEAIENTNDDQFALQRTTIINTLNKERISEGVPMVVESKLLSVGAQKHADDMSAKGYFTLTSPSGVTATDNILSVGYKPKAIGVRLDAMPGGSAEFVSKWISVANADFKATGLNNQFREAGVGIVTIGGQTGYILALALSESDYLQDYTAALSDLSQVRDDMLARVNEERKKVGVDPLTVNEGLTSLQFDDRLNSAAQKHAEDMKTQGYYSHLSLDGRNIGDRVKAEGYNYSTVGENIAKGQRTVKEVMDGWMESKGHRENILNSNYTDFGMGLSFGQNKNGYEILWSQAFGKKKQ